MTDAAATAINKYWPDLGNRKSVISPPRNGVDRATGQLLQGWPHVQQSMNVIFMTRFHERVLRRWVGSFVPMILGRDAIPRVILRFFWAIASALDLWEPDYRIKQVYFMGNAIDTYNANNVTIDAAEMLRLGDAIFRQEGVWYPRGHLGDFTPYEQKAFGVSSQGGSIWDVVPTGTF